MQETIRVTRWNTQQPPTSAELEAALAAEGLRGYYWSNAPGDRYAPHSHPYHKVLYVVSGSITFFVDEREAIELGPGDRLDLPAGTVHSAVVGPRGVTCLEAHRPVSSS
jgi:quercetin dioxygenase-like cupin family protein